MAKQKSLRRHSRTGRRQQGRPRRYALTTLGAASLSCVGPASAGPVLGPGKLLFLLTHLACRPGRRARATELVELLWSSRDAATGHHDLRQAIWQLRRRLGHAAVSCARGEVVLRLRCTVDRDEFLTAVERGALVRAMALYRGDFLAGVAVLDAPSFEQWVSVEGYRLRRLFARAGEAVVQHALAARRCVEAEQLARRVRDADPYEESAWGLLLESLLAAGKPVRAAAEADLLEQVLAADGRLPEPRTRDLLRRVRRAAGPSPPRDVPPGLAPAFAGREREIDVLLEAWGAARANGGRHVHIMSGLGLGKTRLLRELEARLRATGNLALYLQARFPVQRVAFGFASELVTALAQLGGALGISPTAAAALVALNPLLSSRFVVSPDPAREEEALRHRALALLELLTALSEEAPLALLCDDLHWADPASTTMLAWVLDQLGTARVLCITTSATSFPGLGNALRTERLELAPLSGPAVRTLLLSLAPLPRAAWAQRLPALLHRVSGGSPRAVLEQLDDAVGRGRLKLGRAGWASDDPESLVRELARPAHAQPVPLLVAPFVSDGAAVAEGHLADGLTEGLIADLSRVTGLRVVAPASAMRLKGVGDLRQAAAAVGARFVVEGTLNATADRIEIVGRLYDATRGGVVREELCSGGRGELLAMRERLARAVVEALRLPPEERTRSGRVVEDMHAYECYWHARQCILRFRPDELERALEILRHGLQRGGDNALLYATMGMVYWNLVNAGVNPDEALLLKAEEYVNRVFALEPDAPYGHVLAGHIALARSRPRDAVAHYRRALALDPNNPDALAWLGCVYVQAGKLFAARALAHRLLEIDPLTPVNHVLPAFLTMSEGRFEEAVPAHQRAHELDRNPPGHITLAFALARAGHVEEACEVLGSLNERAPGTLTTQYGMFLQHALRGERAEALAAVTPQLAAYVPFVSYLTWHMGVGHALIGECDRAFAWLRRGMGAGCVNYPFLMIDPLLERLRRDERFVPFAEEVRRAWEEFEV